MHFLYEGFGSWIGHVISLVLVVVRGPNDVMRIPVKIIPTTMGLLRMSRSFSLKKAPDKQGATSSPGTKVVALG